MYTPRFNPNSAVSNWKARLDYLKGYPGKAMSGALNGGFFGAGAEITGGTPNDSMGDGYLYETFSASGTMTVTADMTIDMIVVGGGGGWSYGAVTVSYTGGGGCGGVTSVTGLEVAAGDYAVTIGALGSNGASASQYGTNGGNTKITIGGCLISGGGGGYGGWGGSGYAGNGGDSNHGSNDTSPNRGSSGGAGGGGNWIGTAGASGGSSGSERTDGSPPTGTFTVTDGGSGGPGDPWGFPGGGGAGYGSNNGISGYGYEGILWNNFPTSTSRYGEGGSNQATTTPNGHSVTQGTYGRGSNRAVANGYAGVVIARWAE